MNAAQQIVSTANEMELTTGDWALVISLCSFVVALASFVWNVWSKFIYPKGRVRTLARMVSIFPRPKNEEDRLFRDMLGFASAVRFGPSGSAREGDAEGNADDGGVGIL